MLYERIGVGYAQRRVPDPRIEAAIWAALGDSRTVVNIGAGSGSYEPVTTVLAVEPSQRMVAQRPDGAAPAVRAVAGALPVRDGAVDATLAVLTTHHWPDLRQGLAEMGRVSRRQVAVVFDLDALIERMWLCDYLPAGTFSAGETASYSTLLDAWPDARVVVVPVPADCRDGFLAAYWRRPEAYLLPEVQRTISTFALMAPDVLAGVTTRLQQDLADGTWHDRYGGLLHLDELDCGYRIVVNGPP